MAFPLALYHPGTLLGIQVLVAATVWLALWISSKTSVLRATMFSVLALVVTAIATTIVARVPPYPDPKTLKPGEQMKMPPATILLGLLLGPLVFFAYAILTSFLLRKYTNSNRNMDNVYIPIGAAGVAVCVSWFFASAFYFWRGERAKGATAPCAKPAAKSDAKPTTR
jgi:hypothetical protein